MLLARPSFLFLKISMQRLTNKLHPQRHLHASPKCLNHRYSIIVLSGDELCDSKMAYNKIQMVVLEI